jgi:hypothetical protein
MAIARASEPWSFTKSDATGMFPVIALWNAAQVYL